MATTDRKILHHFNLKPIQDPSILDIILHEKEEKLTKAERLKRWMAIIPENIMKLINLALNQERPFLPPDVTPEMMASPNEFVPSLNHMEILYYCLDEAIEGEDYNTAAAIAYVVDRAMYRFGSSRALLKVVDVIKTESPDTPVAPQIVVRKARIMKDDGDLHGAMRVLDGVISRESKWDYKTEDQYTNTKAACVEVRGQILHNLGLWREAIDSLVQSVESYSLLHDDKGTSSSLGLLTRCLSRLSVQDFDEVKQKFPQHFQSNHPCYEAYVQGMAAVRYIEDLGKTLYLCKHQLEAEESLLMFAVQQPSVQEEYQMFQTIVHDMSGSLAGHQTVDFLKSAETFFQFVRALFMISITLWFSPIEQDKALSKYLEQLSVELYRHLCDQSQGELVMNVKHTSNSVKLMNMALSILGLSPLQGSETFDTDLSEQSSESVNLGEETAEKDSSTKQRPLGEMNERLANDVRSERSSSYDQQPDVSVGETHGRAATNSDCKISSNNKQHPTPSEEMNVKLFNKVASDLSSSSDVQRSDDLISSRSIGRSHDYATATYLGHETVSDYDWNQSATFPAVLSKKKQLRQFARKPVQKFVCLPMTHENMLSSSYTCSTNQTDELDPENVDEPLEIVSISVTEISSVGSSLISDCSPIMDLSKASHKKDFNSVSELQGHSSEKLPSVAFSSAADRTTSSSSGKSSSLVDIDATTESSGRTTDSNSATGHTSSSSGKSSSLVDWSASTKNSSITTCSSSALGNNTSGSVTGSRSTTNHTTISCSGKTSSLVDMDATTESSSRTTDSSSATGHTTSCSDKSSSIVDMDATTESSGRTTDSSSATGHTTSSSAKSSSLVDMDATTESTGRTTDSSSATGHTTSSSDKSSTNKSSDLENSSSDSSGLSPLVDLTCSTVDSDTLDSLKLGESVSSDDLAEYFMKWTPSLSDEENGPKIHRGQLCTYNPVTGGWTKQSTIVHLGTDLEIPEGKKGKCRDVFHIQFLHQDEPLGKYVCKRYKKQRDTTMCHTYVCKRYKKQRNPQRYIQDVICQMTAGYYVTKFNQQLQRYKTDIQVQFLPVAHLQLLTPDGDLVDWVNVEPFLSGNFDKLTNNLEYFNVKGRQLATALTHFSYCESRGVLMIVDLQGWLPDDDSGIVYLTDPQFNTQGIKRFSPYDQQEKGMRAFWDKVHPECNDICRFLQLARPN